MDSFTNPPAVVQQAEESEQQLVERASLADSGAAWTVGECASLWTQKYARGRTDEAFATMVGLSRDKVTKRRRVYELFSESVLRKHKLKWTHFYAALSWPDADECLKWAAQNGANVAEMKAYHRMQCGEDLTTEPEPDPEDEPEDVAASTPAQKPPDRTVSTPSVATTGQQSNSGPRRSSAPDNEKQFSLADLRKLLKAAEDTDDAKERRRLADWHRKRADELDPKAKTKARPASIDEVQQYVTEKRLKVDAEHWWQFYESNGWKVGRNPMRDWKAAIQRAHREGWASLGKSNAAEPWRHIEDGSRQHKPETIGIWDEATQSIIEVPADSA